MVVVSGMLCYLLLQEPGWILRLFVNIIVILFIHILVKSTIFEDYSKCEIQLKIIN